MYDGDTCLNNTGLGCACNNGRLSCAPLPTVDPSCPLGCRPSGMVPPPTFDAGAPQDGGHDGGNDGGHDGASDGGNDGGQDGTATDATATDAAGTDATD
jgi:hypothetical protein